MASDADAQAYITQIETDSGETVTANHDSAIDTLVQDLKTDGIWANIDRLYIHDNQPWEEAARRCLKTLTLNDTDYDNSGTPASWDGQAGGYTGNGVDQAISLNFNPTTASGNYSLNSGCFGVFFSGDVSNSHGHSDCNIAYWTNSTLEGPSGEINGGGVIGVDDPLSGFHVVNREDGASQQLYTNGVEIDSDADASGVMPNNAILIGAVNTDGGAINNFNDDTTRAVIIGGALTPTQVSDLYTNLNTYLTSDIGIPSNIEGNIKLLGSNVEDTKVAICTTTDALLSDLTVVEITTTDASGNYTMSASYDNTKNYVAFPIYFEVIASGTATSGAPDSLTDSGQSFTINEFDSENYLVRITGGTGAGQARIITNNTATQVTVEYDWGTQPDATSDYKIGKLYSSPVNFHPTT